MAGGCDVCKKRCRSQRLLEGGLRLEYFPNLSPPSGKLSAEQIVHRDGVHEH